MMKPLGRGMVDRLVDKHRADKHSKGFGCWDQWLAMIYGQLSAASSLRQLATGFNSQWPHHYPLGTRSVPRSTLADANPKRRVAVVADAARVLMRQSQRRRRQDAEQLLDLLDSTSITLKGRGVDC